MRRGEPSLWYNWDHTVNDYLASRGRRSGHCSVRREKRAREQHGPRYLQPSCDPSKHPLRLILLNFITSYYVHRGKVKAQKELWRRIHSRMWGGKHKHHRNSPSRSEFAICHLAERDLMSQEVVFKISRDSQGVWSILGGSGKKNKGVLFLLVFTSCFSSKIKHFRLQRPKKWWASFPMYFHAPCQVWSEFETSLMFSMP